MRGQFRILTLATIAGCGLIGTPAIADSCAESDCRPIVDPKPQPPQKQQQTPPQQPLRLGTFSHRAATPSHQPVTPGKSTRVVKTKHGQYAKVRSARHANAKPEPPAHPVEPPQFLPVVMSPEATASLAMQAWALQAMSQVRVVDADELNEIDRAADTASPPALADETPLVPVRVATTTEPPARTAAPVRETVGRKPDSEPPATRSILSDTIAWIGRTVTWISNGLAAAFATIRSLFI